MWTESTSAPLAWTQPWPAPRDLWALTKPRLSALVFCTVGVGLWLAPGVVGGLRAVAILLASAAVVGGANTLNSYLERDLDARMRRTCNRPLPSGRLEPAWALAQGVIMALASLVALYWAAGPLTTLLGFVAFASYVWVYTPMKRYSWAAVLVGAVPGAIPPAMGWSAATERLDPGAWALFGLLFAWQLPHFFAIALVSARDYAEAQMVVLPHAIGVRATRRWLFVASLVLLPASLWPVYVAAAGRLYASVALATGGAFAGLASVGMRAQVPPRWARHVFLASIVHMALLLLALLLDGATKGVLP